MRFNRDAAPIQALAHPARCVLPAGRCRCGRLWRSLAWRTTAAEFDPAPGYPVNGL